MDLFITIVNHRTPQLLRRCLNSLKEHYPELRRHILVIDNDSRDDSVAMMHEEFPDIRLLASDFNPGFARAVNWGLNHARHRYALILNADIEISKGSLAKMIGYMDKKKDIAMLGPQLISPDGRVQSSCSRFVTPLFVTYRRTFIGKLPWAKKTINHITMSDWDHGEARDVEWFLGAAMLVRRAAMKEVGLMDERFRLYMEDVDWCRRFWQQGWRVHYYPTAKFIHHHLRQSQGSIFSNRLARIHMLSGLKYFAKYWGLTRNTVPKFLIDHRTS